MRWLPFLLVLAACSEGDVPEPAGGERAPEASSRWSGSADVRMGKREWTCDARVSVTPAWAGEKNPFHLFVEIGDFEEEGGCRAVSRLPTAFEPGDGMTLAVAGGRVTARFPGDGPLVWGKGDGRLGGDTELVLRFGEREVHGVLKGTVRFRDDTKAAYEARFKASLNGSDGAVSLPPLDTTLRSRVTKSLVKPEVAKKIADGGSWRFAPDGTFVFWNGDLEVKGTYRHARYQFTLDGTGRRGKGSVVFRGLGGPVYDFPETPVDLTITLLNAAGRPLGFADSQLEFHK